MVKGPGRPKLPKGLKKQPFVLRLDPSIYDRIDKVAAKEKSSRAKVIRKFIETGLESYES